MKHRARLAALSIAVLAALAGAQAALADDPTIYVRYSMACTFTLTGDNGAAITLIPPGRYQVLVTSPQPFAEPDLSGVADTNVACGGSLSFRLTGPGVSFHTTLEDGDAASDQTQATFQVGGTYTAVEDRRPTLTHTFTISASAPSTGGGGSVSGGGTSTPVTKPKETDTGVGPGFRGVLNGSVTTAGKLSLLLKGKKVTSLKAGRYRIVVLDETSRRGFTIQRLGKKATNVTAVRYLGRNEVLVTLSAGKWFYYSPTRARTAFTVVA